MYCWLRPLRMACFGCLLLSAPLWASTCNLTIRVVDLNEAIAAADLAITDSENRSYPVPPGIADKELQLPCRAYSIQSSSRHGWYPTRIGPLHLTNPEPLPLLIRVSHLPTVTPAQNYQFEKVKIPGSDATALIRYTSRLETPAGLRFSGEELQLSIGSLLFTGYSRVNLGMRLVGLGKAVISASGIIIETLNEKLSFTLSEAKALPRAPQ